MKKNIILIVGILFSATTIFALNVNITGSNNTDMDISTDRLMVEIDGLEIDVKKEAKENKGCICTMEYAPVCGQQDEDLVTFGNQCELDCQNNNGGKVKFLYNGVCKEVRKQKIGGCDCNRDIENISCVDTGRGELITSKSDCDWKCTSLYGPRKVLYKGECKKAVKPFEKIPRIDNGYNTGISGGITGINNKVPVPENLDPTNLKIPFDDEDGWVKVDEYFSFNVKTKEWKDDKGICHTCTPENGFTKNGSIVIDGKTIAGAIYKNGKNKIDIEMDQKRGDNFVFLGNGIKIKANNGGEDEDSKLSLEFNGNKIEIDDDLKLEVKDETVLLQGKKISISADDAKEKAKKALSADKVLSFKFGGNNDNVNYVVTTQKTMQFMGLFDFDMEAEVKIDVETGSIVDIDEPWYSFLLF